MERRTQQARRFYRRRGQSSPACVVCVCGMRAACGGPGGLPLGSATHFHSVAIATNLRNVIKYQINTTLRVIVVTAFYCVICIVCALIRTMHIITFRMSRRPREMYCGHARLCVCLSAAASLHYCTDPDVTWRTGRGCPLFVHYWVDLQSVHGLRCYGNTTEMRGRAQR